MSTAPMTIATFLQVAPMLSARDSIMVRGAHGIGKSDVARLLASILRRKLLEQGVIHSPSEFPVIDRRLSQQGEGDLVGLPSTDGEVTRFNPPDWFKRACKEPCFLFLDEINRATNEVMAAAFQIVLDHELNGWKLHPETRVMTAINSGAAYSINEIDPALLDRFWCVDLNATVKDWTTWARSAPLDDDTRHAGLATNIDPMIVDFIVAKEVWLDPKKNADPLDVEPSRRSWDKFSVAASRAGLLEDPKDPSLYALCCGYVGLEATIAFIDFAKTVDKQVSGKDILENFPKVKDKLEKMGTERHNAAIDSVVEYIRKNVKSLNPKQGKNLHDFIESLSGELRLSCWAKLTAEGTEKIDLARSVHLHCAALVLDVFGVAMGEAGIGMMPNVPSIFKAPDKNKKEST